MAVARLTISIKDDLLHELKEMAKEMGTSISGAVALLIRDRQKGGPA